MSDEAPRAVFLSYASQDAKAARGICEALRAAGLEVWFDQSELRGGDAWNQKIRRQIRDCALFLALISANTQRRREGYFRLEWHLAEQRSHLIARGSPFIIPVAIDDTADGDALVPDAFLAVQWMRLRNGVPTPEFIAQMKRLLEGSPAPTPAEAERARTGPLPTERRANRRAGTIIGALGVVVAVAAVYFGLRPHSGGAGAAGPNSSESPPTAGVAAGTAAASGQPPLSEARQLAEKARALFEKWDSTADDFTAADSMMKRALELDSNDASIWAYSSELNSAFDSRGFDKSPARSAASRSQAERAIRLAPGSSEALYALAYWQGHNDPDKKIAESTYERVLKIAPGDARADIGLAQLYTLFLGRRDDGFALLERAAAQPDRTALACYLEFLDYFYAARFAEADRVIRRSVAAGPAANNQGGLALDLLTWKGDVEGAVRALDAVPEAERDEHRTVWMTAYMQLLQRKPDEALKTLARLPDDFIVDSWFVGPKAYWEGRAQALAGRADAARLSWEAGLAVTEKRLKEDPTSHFHLMRAQLLALLGRTDEALVETRTFAELSSGGPAYSDSWDDSPVLVYSELGRADDALPLIAALLAQTKKHAPTGAWPLTPELLKIDPIWDPLRGDLRFQKLVADADKAERAGAAPPVSGRK